jgi:predicted HicB family RNase H-like nuclease
MTTRSRRDGQIVVRIEPELRDELEAAAEADRRSLSQLVRNVLADWVAHARPTDTGATAA